MVGTAESADTVTIERSLGGDSAEILRRFCPRPVSFASPRLQDTASAVYWGELTWDECLGLAPCLMPLTGVAEDGAAEWVPLPSAGSGGAPAPFLARATVGWRDACARPLLRLRVRRGDDGRAAPCGAQQSRAPRAGLPAVPQQWLSTLPLAVHQYRCSPARERHHRPREHPHPRRGVRSEADWRHQRALLPCGPGAGFTYSPLIFGLPRFHASLCAPLGAAVAPLPR